MSHARSPLCKAEEKHNSPSNLLRPATWKDEQGGRLICRQLAPEITVRCRGRVYLKAVER